MLDKQGKPVRSIRPIAELKALPAVHKAGLVDIEIIAVVRDPARPFRPRATGAGAPP